MLQNAGGFQSPGAAKPDDLAAIQVIPGSPDWILAKVITHDPQTDMYKLSDEDVESSKSKWRNRTIFECGNLLVWKHDKHLISPHCTSFIPLITIISI
jgi:hypothetical protein